MKALPPKKTKPARRSPCPLACGLDLFGDRWTLLIIRDLLLGRSRFKDFTSSPESIPTNILSDRLARLLANKVIRRIPAGQGARHFAYELAEKGQALQPIVRAICKWGLTWEKGTIAALGVK